MKIEKLIKDLDPVTIIEFKNYIVENLGEICKTKNSNSKVISNHKCEETFYKNHNINLNAIPSGKHSEGNINISKINGINSQIET